MNDLKYSKRNRSGNFDQDDVELFLNLVNDNKTLIDSSKQDDKKKGWDIIHDTFNENCTGVKRDISALKMKLKNLKAQNKKLKLEPSEDNQDSEQDASMTGDTNVDQRSKSARKRGKMFSPEESLLLQELVEKHFNCLDTSLTRDSLELRNRAWDTITSEFNKAKVNDIERDMNELKIKHKNMKAQRISYKAEKEPGQFHSIVEESIIETDPLTEDNMPRSLRSKLSDSSTNNLHHTETPPVRTYRVVPLKTRVQSKTKKYEALLDCLDTSGDYTDDDDDDDYPPPTTTRRLQPVTSITSTVNKEEERIRKENLLLKNAVLRKKERLLELQIALAERNLRRHQI